MSNVKVDVQWSPVDDDMLITYGTAINLYQAKERDGTFDVSHTDGKYNANNSKIVLLATNSDLQFMKCAAWCPKSEPKNVFAVAQANGRISIVGFGNSRNEDLVGKEFNARFNRQCNFLAWNPLETNLLAQGLERSRSEPCVLIWDVMSNPGTDTTERTRHSFSEGPVTKPYAELGSGETSASFAWFPTDPKTFVVGMAHKHLRVYDLRDVNKPRLEAHHRCVAGVCIEQVDNYRLASYMESQVAIWDLRSFDRPINIITENKNVIKLSWCPTKKSVLSVLSKDSSSVRLHDIRNSLFGSDEIEHASIERNIQPFGKIHLSSFAWHPRHENRLLGVLPSGALRDMTVSERIPMHELYKLDGLLEVYTGPPKFVLKGHFYRPVFFPQFDEQWSSNFNLMMTADKDELKCLEKTEKDDVSNLMKKRISLNYGLHAQDIATSIKAIENEPHLQGLWRWIYNIRALIASQGNSKHRYHPATGIISLLCLDKEDENLSSEPVSIHWKASEGAKYTKRTHYRSNERTMALQLCGWVPDHPDEDFDGFIDGLVQTGDPERASAIALLYLHIKRALEILSNCAMSAEQEGKPNLQAVAMALSGFTEDKNALWRRTCGTLRYQLENPYLRAIFAFLACDEDNYEDVLNEEDMSVEDRIAFALNYLPDAKLKIYLCKLADELTKTGDLDGILLTGMSNKGIDLLENYVDRTSDVQTAAIATVFSVSAAVMKDTRVIEWIEGYRDLLDRWRFWNQRAQFDIVRQSFSQEYRVTTQVHVSCNFCGKSVSANVSFLGRARNLLTSPFSRGPQNRPKVTCCPSCRKALPRCAICLSHMGTFSGSGLETGGAAKLTPFQEWFTWCQTCRHGGHAAHITQWFQEHNECPVTGCTCKCVSQDVVAHRMPQAEARKDEVAIP